MLTQGSQTYREVIALRYAEYDAGIKSGAFQPFVYPWGTFGATVVLLYLLIPRHRSPLLRPARFMAVAINACFAFYTILHCKARFLACSFGIGLVQTWSILWIATILVFNDGVTDFKRIERTAGSWGASGNEKPQEADANGHANPPNSAGEIKAESKARPTQRKGRFMWQSYPIEPFIERLDWVADLFCNFRGIGWDWRISGVQHLPETLLEELEKVSPGQTPERLKLHTDPALPRYSTRSELLRTSIRTFIIGYFALDLLKVMIIHDPYLWGLQEPGAPAWLPEFIRTSPVLLRTYRLVFCLAGVYWALNTIFQLGPIFFCGILGPKRIGARGEPWIYPDQFGSFRHVLDKGLAGWWGGWWHQTFRFAFEAPSKWMVERIGMDRRALSVKALQLILAFSLSGSLHAWGSYTMLPPTRPLSGPFFFFFLQAFGIMGQMMAAKWFRGIGVTQRFPKLVRQLGNFIFVHVWFYYTAPLLADDFARGGIWLFEPVPISPLRALGFGAEGHGWWCWGGKWLYWHQGEHWWQSGFAL